MLFSFTWFAFKYKIQTLLSEGRLDSAQLLHVIIILYENLIKWILNYVMIRLEKTDMPLVIGAGQRCTDLRSALRNGMAANEQRYRRILRVDEEQHLRALTTNFFCDNRHTKPLDCNAPTLKRFPSESKTTAE